MPAFNKRNASLLGLILAEVAMIIYLFNPDNPFRQRHEEAGETLRANETQETVAAYYDAKGAYIRHQIGIAAGMLLIGVGFLVVAYLPKQHPAS